MAVGFAGGLFLGAALGRSGSSCEHEPMTVVRDTVTITTRDTLWRFLPAAVAARPVGLQRVAVASADSAGTPAVDTVLAERTQLVYTDPRFTAWVSGVTPRLDSIAVVSLTTTETVRLSASRPRRWGLSVTAGAALTPRGVQPFVGVGVSYTFLAF